MAQRRPDPPGKVGNRPPGGLFFNLPGRGVLRFLGPAYRNPVQILAIFGKIEKNSQI